MRVPELEALASEMVGDNGSPNVYFVTLGADVQLITLDGQLAYDTWKQLPRNVESALEDRQVGVLCSVAPESDEPGARLRVMDDFFWPVIG